MIFFFIIMLTYIFFIIIFIGLFIIILAITLLCNSINLEWSNPLKYTASLEHTCQKFVK